MYSLVFNIHSTHELTGMTIKKKIISRYLGGHPGDKSEDLVTSEKIWLPRWLQCQILRLTLSFTHLHVRGKIKKNILLNIQSNSRTECEKISGNTLF